MKRRVAILGAGVCGLAVAVRLHEIDPSLDITLVEREDRPGGLARSLTVDGHVADLGPHRIHTELPDVQDFLQDLAGEDLVRVDRRSRMWLRGGWIDYPPRPLEIVRHLGLGAVLRAGASFAAAKLKGMAGRPAGPENFETVMRGAFGDELYRLIVLDYTRKVWKTDPANIHADIARVRVSAGGLDRLARRVILPEKEGRETALRRFYYLPGGVENLVRKMEEQVRRGGAAVWTGQNVENLEQWRTGHWKITLRDSEESTRTLNADFVFSTLPLSHLLGWLLRERADEAVTAARDEMQFLANFLVCVVVDRPYVTDCQWLYFPGPDTVFNRGYEPKNFSPGMAKPGQSMIVLEITSRPGDRYWEAGDEELARLTVEGLSRTRLLKPREVLRTQVHRIPYTYPFYDLGYRKRLSRVWRYLSRWPNLLTVGRQGLFLHNNMDHSIHMGFRAAEVAYRERPGHPERAFYREVRRFQKFRIVD